MLPLNNAFFFQAATGILANSLLLLFRIITLFLNHRTKLTNLITCHLALVHIVMFLTILFSLSPDLFSSLDFQNGFKCKVFFYMYRVMRSLSIYTTSLLSVFQAIIISPSESWLVSLSCNSYQISYTVASSNGNQTKLTALNKHCSLSSINSIVSGLFFTLTISSDVSFVGLMVVSSAYMMILLFRHQRQSRYLHSTSLSSGITPEKKSHQNHPSADTFFCGHVLDELYHVIFPFLVGVNNLIILGLQRILVNVYAIVSPLVLTGYDKRIINILQLYFFLLFSTPQQHMEVPSPGVKLELWLQAYATAIAM
uniref:Vomeronasal type-1 receptor n=1 Tax=Sus scrofa TaxID=9823 RepID=A0A8D1GQL8_PIG